MAEPVLQKILVIDDDAEMRRLLAAYLNRHGYEAAVLADANRLDRHLERLRPHLIVLDLMLPGADGLSVCRRLRANGDDIPIIMLTARGETVDRIVGLEFGADDYLGKPFDPRELVARIEAVLRRRNALSEMREVAAAPVVFGNFVFDRQQRQLARDGEPIPLTRGEFDLLRVFADYAFKPLRRDRLLELVHQGENEPFGRSIDVQVSRLRRYIEVDPKLPRYIQTIWGFGYIFVPTGEQR